VQNFSHKCNIHVLFVSALSCRIDLPSHSKMYQEPRKSVVQLWPLLASPIELNICDAGV
jgi:hypothetical protein